MKNHEFNTILVADDSEMDLYVAFPEGDGNFPAVIVLQEAFGVTPHIRNVAERFCKAGYAVVAPDLFHRTITRLEAAYDQFPVIAEHFQAITKEGLTADLRATYSWLQQQPQVIQDKIASIGYCLGGRVSFLANAVLPLAAAVSYYGGGIEQLVDEVPNLHAPHLFFWGGLDKHITRDKIDITMNALKNTEKAYTNVVISYADHGFNCDDRAAYHPLAAKQAWGHVLGYFDHLLGNKDGC